MFASPSELWGYTLPYNLAFLCHSSWAVEKSRQNPGMLVLQGDRRGLRLGQNGGGGNLR